MIHMMIIVSVQKLIDRGVLEAYCQEKGYDPARIAENETFDLTIEEAMKYRVLRPG